MMSPKLGHLLHLCTSYAFNLRSPNPSNYTMTVVTLGKEDLLKKGFFGNLGADYGVMKRLFVLFILSLPLVWACENMDYDISEGVDNEITLFGDQVSVPIGDVGPLTPKSMLGDSGEGTMDAIKDYVKEDEEGYLVVEDKNSFYDNYVMLINYLLPDQTIPIDLPVDDASGNLKSSAEILEGFGFTLSPQVFTLCATNPLTEDISVSGSMKLLSAPGDVTPAELLKSQVFTNAKVKAETTDAEVLKVELTDKKPVSSYIFENIFLHLPASMLEKDPLSGFSAFSLSYKYKSYISFGNDLPGEIPVDIDDLDLQLAQYRVKEAKICTEVSNEIPVTLELTSVDVYMKQIDADGKVSSVKCDDVSVTSGLRINSGTSGNPTITPLEIVIKADKGTIPDISRLSLTLAIKAPTGDGDKRLNMNQAVYFNKLRATVSGGITIQGL